MSRILTTEDCIFIDERLSEINQNMNSYCEQIDAAIDVFNRTAIVQSFYESGSFGKEMEAELLKIKDGIQQYASVLSSDSGLIPTTRRIVDSQRSLLNRGNGGGN